MSKKWQMPLLVGAVFIVALAAGGGGTFALWNAKDEAPAATITAGDLDVSRGAITWTETSADVTSAPHVIDPATFLVRQGDTFEVDYTFATELAGDHMLAGLSLGWPAEGAPGALVLPVGVSGSYRVFAGSDPETRAPIVETTAVGVAPVLDVSTMKTLEADGFERSDNFSMVVSLDFNGLSDRFGSHSTAQRTDLGAFTMTLDQRRSGEGFE